MTDIIDNTGKKSEWTPPASETLFDGLIDFTTDPDNRKITGIVRRQEITDEYLQQNHDIRVAQSARSRIGDYMPVASIPVEVAEYMRIHLGYDVTREPFKKTVALLKQHGLDHFVLTNKSL